MTGRPVVDCQAAIELAVNHFGLGDIGIDSVKELVSYEDRNFYMRGCLGPGADMSEFVLKVLHYEKSATPTVLLARYEVAVHVKKTGFQCPVPVRSVAGNLVDFTYLLADKNTIQNTVQLRGDETCPHNKSSKEKDLPSPDSCLHGVCLLHYVPGVVASDKERRWPDELLADIGRYAGRLCRALQGLRDTDTEKVLADYPLTGWDLRSTRAVNDVLSKLQFSKDRMRLLKEVIEAFCKFVEPKFAELRAGVIHNDFNDANLLLPSVSANIVSGIIDFSDCIYSHIMFELATCMAFFSCGLANPVRSMSSIVQGFNAEMELLPCERGALYYCVAGRLAQIHILVSEQYSKDPTNDYLLPDIEPSFEVLVELWTVGKTAAEELWWPGS